MLNRRSQPQSGKRPLRTARLCLERLEDRLAPHSGITQFALPTPAAAPAGIVLGPDNNFWFAEFDASRIGRIGGVSTSNTITEFTLPAGRGPVNLTVGPDGNIWFTENTGNRIGRINPLAGDDAAIQASILEFAVPGAGSNPNDIVSGPDGALWFTQSGSDEIGRITTAGVFTEFAVPQLAPGNGAASNPSVPGGITAGSDGALWFTQAGSGEIGRITTAGVVTEFSIPVPNAAAFSDPEDIVSGPGGHLYFTDFGRDQIGRITTAGQITQFDLPVGRGPNQIVAAPDGNLYFTETASGRLGKLPANALAPGRPTSGAPPLEEFDFVARDSAPLGIALDGSDDIFFTLNNGNAIATFEAHLAQITITGVGSQINVFDIHLNPVRTFSPFDGFQGSLNLAVQDMAGAHAVGNTTNGVPDALVVPSFGPAHVKVFDGSDNALLASFYAFDPAFVGNIAVAAADVNNDGRNDVVVSAGAHVKVIDGTKLGQVQANGVIADSALLASFFAFPFASVSGLSLGTGDVNRDGRADIVIGAGFGAPPHVKVIDAAKVGEVQPDGQIADSALLGSFFAFAPGYTGGVSVTVAFDVSRPDIVVGSGAGTQGHVKVIDSSLLGQVQANGQIADSALRTSFFAFGAGFLGGVRVAADDLTNADGVPELFLSAGPGAGPHVKVVNGANMTVVQANGVIADSALLASFFVGPPAFTGGVSIAADADHRDASFGGTATTGVTAAQSRRDVNDMYIFQSPTNTANTVIAMTVSPFTGPGTVPQFEPGMLYDLRVVNSDLLNATDDLAFRVTFGPADPANGGVQDVQVRALPAAKFPGTGGVIVKAFTNSNVDVRGVGGSGAKFRAADQDDPFFFDTTGFNQFLNASADAGDLVLSNGTTANDTAVGPYPTGTSNNGAGDSNANGLGFDAGETDYDYNGVNFFANSNTLAITLELPSVLLAGLPAGSTLVADANPIGYWGRTEVNGVQQDRMGRPAINTALVPPVPRNSPLSAAQVAADVRGAFNSGHPRDDRTNFADDVTSVLASVYPIGRADFGAPAGQAALVASLLLPDVLVYDPTSTAGFFADTVGTLGSPDFFLAGGRHFTDDTITVELQVLSDVDTPFNLDGGADSQPLINTQNVADDNGLAITDGSLVGPRPAGDPLLGAQRSAVFPYFAPPNQPAAGVPNPPGGPRP